MYQKTNIDGSTKASLNYRPKYIVAFVPIRVDLKCNLNAIFFTIDPCVYAWCNLRLPSKPDNNCFHKFTFVMIDRLS